jgi:glycosyltransferase involved in cell wall biosynthesis
MAPIRSEQVPNERHLTTGIIHLHPACNSALLGKVPDGIVVYLESKVAPMEVKNGYSRVSLIEDRGYPTISVVIPARNEAQNLRHVLPRIPSMVSEVILVDGCSTDDTIAVAQELLRSIRIVKQNGRGKGDALRAGFAACTGDIIVMLDADGSADPREIPCFVEALLAGRDFAKGSRFIRGGGSRDITILRYWGNFCLNMLVNVLFFARFSDLCYGYNAFWRHCLDYMKIDCDGFEVETMINLRIHKANLKIVEVASFEYSRIHGESNLRAFRDGWRVLKTILKEWFAIYIPANFQRLHPFFRKKT